MRGSTVVLSFIGMGVLFAPSIAFGGDLQALDGLVDSLAPSSQASPDAEAVSGLQRELRKTIRAVEYHYDAVFDPTGANERAPKRTQRSPLSETELNAMVAQMRQQMGRAESDAELKARLRQYLQSHGVPTVEPTVVVREAPQAGVVERLSTWAEGLFDRVRGR